MRLLFLLLVLSGCGNDFRYWGGRLIENPEVQVVYWNDDVFFQDLIPNFWKDILVSPHVDGLKEYSTNGYNLGRGTYVGSVKLWLPPTNIENDELKDDIDKFVDAGYLKESDKNTIYALYFPPGMVLTKGKETSCKEFCAYHSQTSKGRTFMVFPDMVQCDCGGGLGRFDVITINGGHELAESITDPCIGTFYGWGDLIHTQEISDVCSQKLARRYGYIIQGYWSNEKGACVYE